MKIYETQTSGRISQRHQGIMLREDPEYIWIYDQAHTKDTLSPVFAKRCLLFSVNLPIVMDNWQGCAFHWDADYAHRNKGGAFWYGPHGNHLATGNGQLNMLGINPTVTGQSSYDPDYYYTAPFTNNDASNSLWKYKIHAPSGEVVNKAYNKYGALIYFFHETEEYYFGLNCYHHGSARFVRMSKTNDMAITNLGQYNDSGHLLGPQILYKTDKAVISFTCHHQSSNALAFTVQKNYYTDEAKNLQGDGMRTPKDLSVTYSDWTKGRLRKSLFKLNQSGYEADTLGSGNSYVGMENDFTKTLSDRQEETRYNAKNEFHMHSLAAIVHDHDPSETGLIKDHEMLRWYAAYCDEDGVFQILRYNMTTKDTVLAPTYDVRKCNLSNPLNLEAPTIDTIEAHGYAYMGSDDRAEQAVQLAYFTDKKAGVYEHYLLMSFANIIGSNIMRGSGPNYNYNKMYVYKITNKAEFLSNGDSQDEIDSLDLSLHQVIVEQDMAFGLLRPNFDAKTFVYCTRTDNHPVYIWNNDDQVFDKKTSLTAQAVNFAADSDGRIYTMNYHKDDDFSIDMFTLDIPSKVLLEMDEYEFEYSGSTLDKEVRVKAINWKSELIEAKVNLKVVGSGVSLVDAGNSNAEVNTLEVTTDDSDWLTIPIKINSGSAVKINASISPN